MKAKKMLVVAVLAIFVLGGFAAQAEAVKCVSIFNKKFKARQSQVKKMKTLANKLSQLLKKRRAAMSKVKVDPLKLSKEQEEERWNHPSVVKIQKKMNKNAKQQNKLSKLIAKTALAMDAAVKKCQKEKVDAGQWKRGWNMDKFTVKIVGIGINETEKEKAFNDCFGAWITKYRNARVFTKGIMDAHQECEDIHTEWMKYEKMRYELLDDAFK